MLNKFTILLICAFMLTACSFSFNQPPPPPTSEPSLTFTPSLTPSITPTLPTPTFTSTPTLVGYKSPTPTPTETATPVNTETPTVVVQTVSTPTPVVKAEGFHNITSSTIVFYRGKDCSPASVKFTVQMNSDVNAEFVQLFTRFVSKTSSAKSTWTSIGMQNLGGGLFEYELFPTEMLAIDSYIDPWVQFQFVATDGKGKEIKRTGVFDKQLTLLACVPTETPVASPTATVLKP